MYSAWYSSVWYSYRDMPEVCSTLHPVQACFPPLSCPWQLSWLSPSTFIHPGSCLGRNANCLGGALQLSFPFSSFNSLPILLCQFCLLVGPTQLSKVQPSAPQQGSSFIFVTLIFSPLLPSWQCFCQLPPPPPLVLGSGSLRSGLGPSSCSSASQLCQELAQDQQDLAASPSHGAGTVRPLLCSRDPSSVLVCCPVYSCACISPSHSVYLINC